MRFGTYTFLQPSGWRDRFGDVNYGLGVRLTKYDTTNNFYTFILTLPYEYQTKIRILAYNPHASIGYHAEASIQYLDLT